MSPKHEYRVYFSNGINVFHWRLDFKTFGGAYRYAKRKMSEPHFASAHGFTAWAVVRATREHTKYDTQHYGVILAMSKGYSFGSGFRHRNLLDYGVS